MNLNRAWENLLPGAAERDEPFREYLAALSHAGLRTLGLVEMALPLVLHLARAAISGASATDSAQLAQTSLVLGTGVLTLAASRLRWSFRRPRLLAGVSLAVASAAVVALPLAAEPGRFGADDYISSGIATLVLTAVATVPFRPLHTLGLGLAVEGMYILSWLLAVQREGHALSGQGDAPHLFILMATLLATGIAAGNYRNRRSEHEARREAVRVAEALTGAQLRAQLAENAISIGKLAAALAHEINSPLGVLRSSIDTLLAATDRQLASPNERRAQLDETRKALAHSIRESAARIEQVMSRLRRFVNLEEAESKSADINELLSDVALLHQHEWQDRVQLELDLQPLEPLTCRPQLITAVFSSLLSNAIQAVDRNGRIVISTRRLDTGVEAVIEDNGRGMTAAQLETLFDPSFKVTENRVASGNWSLFNTRQIVYEHGGDIEVASEAGKGTRVRVTLPA